MTIVKLDVKKLQFVYTPCPEKGVYGFLTLSLTNLNLFSQFFA